MSKQKDKTIELITPPCAHGRSMAAITDADGSVTLETVSPVESGAPLLPGATLMTTEPIEGEPRLRRITAEHTTPGPARVATPSYRKGYDAISWGKPPEGPPN